MVSTAARWGKSQIGKGEQGTPPGVFDPSDSIRDARKACCKYWF